MKDESFAMKLGKINLVLMILSKKEQLPREFMNIINVMGNQTAKDEADAKSKNLLAGYVDVSCGRGVNQYNMKQSNTTEF